MTPDTPSTPCDNVKEAHLSESAGLMKCTSAGSWYGLGASIYLLVLDHEEDLQSITDVVQGGTLFENINYRCIIYITLLLSFIEFEQ